MCLPSCNCPLNTQERKMIKKSLQNLPQLTPEALPKSLVLLVQRCFKIPLWSLNILVLPHLKKSSKNSILIGLKVSSRALICIGNVVNNIQMIMIDEYSWNLSLIQPIYWSISFDKVLNRITAVIQISYFLTWTRVFVAL